MQSSADKERRRRFDRIVAVFHQDMYRYALDALRDDDASKPWLLTIVRRENARYFERKRLDTVDIDDLTPAQSAMIAEEDNEQVREMREAILRLEDDYREPLVLQVLMGHGTQEIADLMGLKQGAVLTRLHRARLKLRDVVMEDAG